MICGAAALLLCLLLPARLQEAAASPRGRCAGELCSFQGLLDFHGATKSCKELNGELFTSKEIKKVTSLLKGLSGRFWLGKTKQDPHDCPAVSVEGGQDVTALWVSCTDKLDGHVCWFKPEEVCRPLQVSGGEEVTYSTPSGYELLGSDMLPPGTFATVGDPKHPGSKHLCASIWMEAPWTCEVLKGGCEHNCSSQNTCICPSGHTLHPNNISCVAEARGCQKEGDSNACTCNEGFRPALDGKSCEDVNECEEKLDGCTAEGEKCVNEEGRYRCECAEDFVEEDGACVNNSICFLCEHKCDKINGVYQCVCNRYFRVSHTDPTRCEQHCGQSQCAARCVRDQELHDKDMQQCFCPEGYILERTNHTAVCYDIDECEQENPCDHRCENTHGGYRCWCDQGFKLVDDECVKLEEEDDERGSGSSSEVASPPHVHTAALPPYVKAGSVMGIAVFLVLGAVMLVFLTRRMLKRCSTFNLATFKHPDIDIFYLQQVTTETYKRFSFDKQIKNDSQR